MKRLILGLLFVSLFSAAAFGQSAVQIFGPGPQPTIVQFFPVLLNALSTSVTAVKTSSAGRLGAIYCYNANASVAYLQIFDVATAAGVTLGSTVPKLSLGVPTAQSSGLGPAVLGITFQNGIQVAVTTTATGNSATASGMDCNAAVN